MNKPESYTTPHDQEQWAKLDSEVNRALDKKIKQIDNDRRKNKRMITHEELKELIEEANKEEASNPLNQQVGGSHYKDFVIQPVEFTHKNKLNFCQGNVIKYISRYKNKNGLEDLKKVIHYVELLIELEYGDSL